MHYACPFLHFSLFQDDIFAEPFLGNLSGFTIFDDLVNTVIQNIHKDLIIFFDSNGKGVFRYFTRKFTERIQ